MREAACTQLSSAKTIVPGLSVHQIATGPHCWVALYADNMLRRSADHGPQYGTLPTCNQRAWT